jgi:hypothetical protein
MQAERSKVDANTSRRNLAHKLEMPSIRNDMNQMVRPGTSFDVDAQSSLPAS